MLKNFQNVDILAFPEAFIFLASSFSVENISTFQTLNSIMPDPAEKIIPCQDEKYDMVSSPNFSNKFRFL